MEIAAQDSHMKFVQKGSDRAVFLCAERCDLLNG